MNKVQNQPPQQTTLKKMPFIKVILYSTCIVTREKGDMELPERGYRCMEHQYCGDYMTLYEVRCVYKEIACSSWPLDEHDPTTLTNTESQGHSTWLVLSSFAVFPYVKYTLQMHSIHALFLSGKLLSPSFDNIGVVRSELSLRDLRPHSRSRADSSGDHFEQLIGIICTRPLLMSKNLAYRNVSVVVRGYNGGRIRHTSTLFASSGS